MSLKYENTGHHGRNYEESNITLMSESTPRARSCFASESLRRASLIFLVQCQGVLEQRNNIVSPALCFSEHVRGWGDSAIIEHLSGISKILGFCPALKKMFLIIE